MRFDYTRDMAPELVDRMRALRIDAHLRGPLYALITIVIVAFAALGIENWRLSDARAQEAFQQARFDESKARLAQMKIESRHVEDLLALDKRLRTVRLSGSVIGVRLADIANHVPEHAWLTAIGRSGDGVTIEGRAENLDSLSATVASLMMSKTVSAPNLVKAQTDRVAGGAKPVVNFQIAVSERRSR